MDSANFLTTMSFILDLDAQLQIMMELFASYNYLDENTLMSEQEILKCSSFDYKFCYLEQFGYRGVNVTSLRKVAV